MIQKQIDKVLPYFRGLKIAEEYNMLEFTLKSGWGIPNHDEIGSQETEGGYIFYSNTMSFDEIIDWVEESVINYNLEIEEKERLLAAKVEELKKVFETSSLDELNKLKFSTEGQTLKLNTTPKPSLTLNNESNDNDEINTEEDGTTEELSRTEHTTEEEI